MVKLSKTNYTQQHEKKRVGPISSIIIVFLNQQTHTKMVMKHNKGFLRTLCFIFAKDMGRPFSTCENVWFHKLVLHHCLCVVFPS
jgi:hypothetical protein